MSQTQTGEKELLKISVRNLVEFILRSGDIDNRKASAPDTAMQEGGRIHRMLQRRMGADYHAEVNLKYSYHTPRYDILVEGRADGIIDGQLARRIMKEVPVSFEGCFDQKAEPGVRGGTEGGLKRVEENRTGDGTESSKKAEAKMYAEKGIEGQLCFLS